MKSIVPTPLNLDQAEAEYQHLAEEVAALTNKIQRTESGQDRRDFLLGRAARERSANDAKVQHLLAQISPR